MALVASCPSTFPPGITLNSTELYPPNGIAPIFAGVVWEQGSITPTNRTMNAMLKCCVNSPAVYMGEHNSSYYPRSRHCGLWCEMDAVRDVSNSTEDSAVWEACMTENSDAIVSFVHTGEPEEHVPAMGTGLRSPGMIATALVSLMVAAAFLG